jgi:hypothetical protein
VDVIGQLVQRLQRERGASCISWPRKPSGLPRCHRAVNEALLHEEKLRQVFSAQMDPAQGTSAQTLSLMAWALLGLESLPALRLQIDRQAMSALDAVAAYSHLIAGLVELVFHMADTAGVPSVSRLLVALLHAVQATEEAGQERAMGALLFASGHCQEAHQQRLLHLIDAQERSLRVFGDFAEPALRARWDELQLAPCMAQLERLRRAVRGSPRHSARQRPQPGSVPAPNAWTGCGSCNRTGPAPPARGLRPRIAACAAGAAGLRGPAAPSARKPAAAHPCGGSSSSASGSTHGARCEQAGHPPTSASPPRLRSSCCRPRSQRLASMEMELEAARRALHERKIIERAKGVLMARMGLSEEAAFRALQKTAMDQNRRLLDVAEATLALPDLAFAARGRCAALR